MNYGDFSSLVQLGVGLHAGTALLQLYGEIGVAPLVRALQRIDELTKSADKPNEEVVRDLEQLNADFLIFRIKLFNEYKKYVGINFAVAAMLVITLIVISFNFESSIGDSSAVAITASSILPAPLTLLALWIDASREMGPLKATAKLLEQRALRQG